MTYEPSDFIGEHVNYSAAVLHEEPIPLDHRLASYGFDLPAHLIAQKPCETRDGSRLLVVDKGRLGLQHRRFSDIVQLLRAGDVLVLNNSRVFPARLKARRQSGGLIEVLLLAKRENVLDVPVGETWEAWVRPSARVRPGERLLVGAGLSVLLLIRQDRSWIVQLEAESIDLALLDYGEVPLPPYIFRSERARQEVFDRERYQTVYAQTMGSAAAPTAGLHFTWSILEQLNEQGVQVEFLTLHVGPGTFAPVKTADITMHEMHAEAFLWDRESWARVQEAKRQGRRVIAVGTTAVRVLETLACGRLGTVDPSHQIHGMTNLFIYPGFRFNIVNAMITNFHLPYSSLIMLVSALGGRSRILEAYRVAVEQQYRFYSYGDAMFVES